MWQHHDWMFACECNCFYVPEKSLCTGMVSVALQLGRFLSKHVTWSESLYEPEFLQCASSVKVKSNTVLECRSGQQKAVQQGMCSQWWNSVDMVTSEAVSSESVVPNQCWNTSSSSGYLVSGGTANRHPGSWVSESVCVIRSGTALCTVPGLTPVKCLCVTQR